MDGQRWGKRIAFSMNNVNINNSEVLNALNNYKDFIMNNNIQDNLHLMCSDKKDKAEYYIGEEHRKLIISKGEAHDGFPEIMHSFTGLMPSKDGHFNASNTPAKTQKFTDASSRLNSELMQLLSARTNTLNTVYPPGGFISWHNNANASGFNVLFSWSETGEGWFEYWDMKKQEKVRIDDVPGWQCKMGYFGPYYKPETLCYHTAYTKCWRISVGFVFAEADNIWKEVIQDIENPI